MNTTYYRSVKPGYKGRRGRRKHQDRGAFYGSFYNNQGFFWDNGNFNGPRKFQPMGNLKPLKGAPEPIIMTKYGPAATKRAKDLETLWGRLQTILTTREQEAVITITKKLDCRGPAGRIQEAIGIIQANFAALLTKTVESALKKAEGAQEIR